MTMKSPLKRSLHHKEWRCIILRTGAMSGTSRGRGVAVASQESACWAAASARPTWPAAPRWARWRSRPAPDTCTTSEGGGGSGAASSTCSVSAASGCRGDRRTTSSDRQQGKGQWTFSGMLKKVSKVSFCPRYKIKGSTAEDCMMASVCFCCCSNCQIIRETQEQNDFIGYPWDWREEEWSDDEMIFFDNILIVSHLLIQIVWLVVVKGRNTSRPSAARCHETRRRIVLILKFASSIILIIEWLDGAWTLIVANFGPLPDMILKFEKLRKLSWFLLYNCS